jgi:RNA 3'-terminal phosphate cyclase (ATP)
MITIDGSYGEGGGQIMRTALGLSLVTGKPFTIHNIRAGRRKPGLMRQHLTALNAAAEIGGAGVSGNETGSTAFTFEPGPVRPGSYRFSIGSAGSSTLVLQTVLPALMVANGPSQITLEGGTHNPFAPPFDFLTRAFLPIIGKLGPVVTAELEKPGFYPAGGGRFHVTVEPADRLAVLDLTERGAISVMTAEATVAHIPLSIARRELDVLKKRLNLAEESVRATRTENSAGPGNVLTVDVESRHVTEVFTGFGEKGVSAEKVASRCAGEVREYLASGAVAGKYLADQLLVPMAMAGGGRFTTVKPTGHTTTNIEIIRKFLEVDIAVTVIDEAVHRHEIIIS